MSIALLEAAAAALGDLCPQVVFLGGATIGLWMTDPAARAPRVTYDVDVVAEVVTLAGMRRFRKRCAGSVTLTSGAIIRAVPPAYLLATKLEAFADRGHDDCLGSRDFEDIVLLFDSREELAGEVASALPDAQSYIRSELARLSKLPSFAYGVEGSLLGADAAERAEGVTMPRLLAMAGGA